MNVDVNQIATILKDFKIDIGVLKSRQNDLLKRIRKSIELNKLDKIKKNLNK